MLDLGKLRPIVGERTFEKLFGSIEDPDVVVNERACTRLPRGEALTSKDYVLSLRVRRNKTRKYLIDHCGDVRYDSRHLYVFLKPLLVVVDYVCT